MTAQQRGWGRWLVAAGLVLCAVAPLSAHPPSGTLTTVALFNPALLETPESIVTKSANGGVRLLNETCTRR